VGRGRDVHRRVERDEYVTPEEVSMKVPGGTESVLPRDLATQAGREPDRERYLGAAEGQSEMYIGGWNVTSTSLRKRFR
jgi:hypothetical protein